MRLSGWRSGAPRRESLGPKVVAAIEPVLGALGAQADPDCWIAWGDDPEQRYVVFVPTAAGLIVCHVRVNVPGEGPRASAKLVRWPRVQVGELSIDTQAGHRLLTTQLEGQVLRGVDAEADRVAMFILSIVAAQDGRPAPTPTPATRRRATAGRATPSPARAGARGPTQPGRRARPAGPPAGTT